MDKLRIDAIEIMGKDGRVCAILDASNAGSPALRLFDDAGRVRLGIYVLPDGTPTIKAWDENGQLIT